MSREIDLLSKEFAKKPATVMTTHLLLMRASMQTASAAFLRDVERQCRKQKSVYVRLIAVVE